MRKEKEEEKRLRGLIVIIPNSQPEEKEEYEARNGMEEAVRAGVARESIEEARIVRGRLHVKVRESKVLETLTKVAETPGNKARALESWAAIVLFDMDVEK